MPRKPVRADGIETYDKLLNEIEASFSKSNSASVSLRDVADAVQVPVASVYHFFPMPEAALAALTERYVELSAIEIMSNHVSDPEENWQGVINDIFSRGRRFYKKYPAARKLRLAAHNSESARYLILESNWALAETIYSELDRLFVLPEASGLVDDIARAIVISDALWSLSVSIHGAVTDEFAMEAERAVSLYLFPVLGPQLATKAS